MSTAEPIKNAGASPTNRKQPNPNRTSSSYSDCVKQSKEPSSPTMLVFMCPRTLYTSEAIDDGALSAEPPRNKYFQLEIKCNLMCDYAFCDSH